MIVNAPSGSTSAALGSGITDNSALAINASDNQSITNNIKAQATSGDASVENNTTAGNATSGDAHAAVNILNMNGSQFALSDWFGVLFINVLGSWNGSFGIDTAAGNLPSAATPAVAATSGVNVSDIQAFRFVPSDDGNYSLESSSEGVAALAEAHVLSAQQSSQQKTETPQPSPATDILQGRDWTLTLITMMIGLSLLGTERVLNRRVAKRG